MNGRKILAVEMIRNKLENGAFYTYKEIAEITSYHPKYLLKLKKEILDGTIKIEHGNKNKHSYNALTKEEEEKIINLYKRSKASILKFKKFYSKRSYSCIYNVLKRNGLITNEDINE